MVNTMFRPANHYSPKESFEFLCRDVNATWYPYNLTKPHNANRPILSSFGVDRIFCLSIRRGMLPWRRCELYIAKPYHPKRVARQFRLDQIILNEFVHGGRLWNCICSLDASLAPGARGSKYSPR